MSGKELWDLINSELPNNPYKLEDQTFEVQQAYKKAARQLQFSLDANPAEPFSIRAVGDERVWTRDTLAGAKALADNVARREGKAAVVTLRTTGWIEYLSCPVHGDQTE